VLRALIFDFDGLIVDSEIPVFQAWQETYRAHGLELPLEFWRTVIGRGSNYFDPISDLEAKVGRALERESLDSARRARVEVLMADRPVLGGVRELRAEAATAGVRLGLASGSSSSWVLGNLDRLGLGEGWDCIRCRDHVSRPKPAPDVYQAVLDCLQVEAGEAVALEDSEYGVAAAKAAGLFCVVVPSALTRDQDLSRADLRLESLSDGGLAELESLIATASAGSR